MRDVQVLIVGGGISGLYAAHLLEKEGIHNYVLLEAKDSIGGRVQSPSRNLATDFETQYLHSFDVGGAWYWPAIQPRLDRLIKDLGLQSFPQYELGDMLIDRANFAKPMRINGYSSAPPMMRLLNGMTALAESLHARLDLTRITTGVVVEHIKLSKQKVEVKAKKDGVYQYFRTDKVLLAIPPRLVTSTIKFTPNLPGSINQGWSEVNTWMATQAKYLAVYERPFWRPLGLSGEAISDSGPLGEIHDATIPNKAAALFGFFSMPPAQRVATGEQELKSQCRDQLVRMFGNEAGAPKFEYVKDWALDKYTSTKQDLRAVGEHPKPSSAFITTGSWRKKIIGISSEWSVSFPGYIAGAIDAAANGVQRISKEITSVQHMDKIIEEHA